MHLQAIALELYERLRAQTWLRLLHSRLPASWRKKISRAPDEWLAGQLRFPSLPTWVQEPGATVSGGPITSLQDSVGVNIFGFMRGQFGLAESARTYASAMISAGIPVTLHDVDLDVPHGLGDRTFEGRIGGDPVHPVDLIFVNPDHFSQVIASIHASTKASYRIGCWFWELERVPTAWLPAIEQVDEIMVASEFVERAFRKVTSKPILRVPLPLARYEDSGLGRADFSMDETAFFFLTSFDFNSSIQRKNVYDVIQAFERAFPKNRDDVRLLIKTSNGFRYIESMLALLARGAHDARIIVRDEILPRSHIHALQRCCDAYVSLHRAEGFGLGMAECMALGKPVIATAWSGNLEFMNPGNSWLVGYHLIPVPSDAYVHGEGQVWAQPDLEEAAKYMREVVDGRASIQRQKQAKKDIERMLAPERAGAAIAERIKAISLDL